MIAVPFEVLAGDLAEDSGEGLIVLFLFSVAGTEQDFVDVVAGGLSHAFGTDDQGRLVAAGGDGVVGGEDRGGAGGAGVLVSVGRCAGEFGEHGARQCGFEALAGESVVEDADVDDVDVGRFQSRLGDGVAGDVGHHLGQR